MKKELWYFLINGRSGASTGLFRNFYAYGEHLGDALDKVFTASAQTQFHADNVLEATVVEKFELIEDRTELIQLNDAVYMRDNTFPFSLDDPEKEFQPPIGIVKVAGMENNYDYNLIAENFVAYDKDENDLYVLELNVGKADLKTQFLKSIDTLPSVDAFWIYV